MRRHDGQGIQEASGSEGHVLSFGPGGHEVKLGTTAEAPILDSTQEIADIFAVAAHRGLKHTSERDRAETLVRRWIAAWQGPKRTLDLTRSNHGYYLHFNQLLGTVWVQVFGFHADPRNGLTMRGPDTDRTRKSHKLRSNRLDSGPLDALFTAWSAYPEARPAGNAVEFLLVETTDETWEACLQDVFTHLGK